MWHSFPLSKVECWLAMRPNWKLRRNMNRETAQRETMRCCLVVLEESSSAVRRKFCEHIGHLRCSDQACQIIWATCNVCAKLRIQKWNMWKRRKVRHTKLYGMVCTVWFRYDTSWKTCRWTVVVWPKVLTDTGCSLIPDTEERLGTRLTILTNNKKAIATTN